MDLFRPTAVVDGFDPAGHVRLRGRQPCLCRTAARHCSGPHRGRNAADERLLLGHPTNLGLTVTTVLPELTMASHVRALTPLLSLDEASLTDAQARGMATAISGRRPPDRP